MEPNRMDLFCLTVFEETGDNASQFSGSFDGWSQFVTIFDNLWSTQRCAGNKKFISIGAPFNDFTESAESIDDVLKNGPDAQSSRYTDYENGLSNVPNTLPILLIAGKLDENTASDGTVPLNSALATYSLLEAHGNPVEYQIFTGQNAQHSQLHENLEVDEAVADFLWK